MIMLIPRQLIPTPLCPVYILQPDWPFFSVLLGQVRMAMCVFSHFLFAFAIAIYLLWFQFPFSCFWPFVCLALLLLTVFEDNL